MPSIFRKNGLKIGFLALLSLFFAEITAFSQKIPRVIVIGFDGLGGYAFPQSNTPYLKQLAAEGSYTYKAKSIVPTMSSPNWASMINGVPPAKHKIWSNAWQPKKGKNKSFCGNPKGQLFPTIFRLLREQIPAINMACVYDWDGFARLTEQQTFTTLTGAQNEDETVQKAITLIQGQTPDFLFLHIDHVDHVGHAIGHNTPAYYKAVEKADSLTGTIIQALKQKGIYEETYILVTSDHGGRLRTHGGLTPQEINIPWIIRGPRIKHGFAITELVKQYDTAATLAYIFGITPPDCWMGKPVKSAFL